MLRWLSRKAIASPDREISSAAMFAAAAAAAAASDCLLLCLFTLLYRDIISPHRRTSHATWHLTTPVEVVRSLLIDCDEALRHARTAAPLATDLVIRCTGVVPEAQQAWLARW
jgi:hypothetical protein